MTIPLFPGGGFEKVTLATPVDANSLLSAGTATAQYRLAASGDVLKTSGNNAVVDVGDWVTPKSGAPNYECFATLDSGVLTSGTTGAWLALTADRTWTKSQAAPGSNTAQITVQIRHVGTVQILATAVVTLLAEINA